MLSGFLKCQALALKSSLSLCDVHLLFQRLSSGAVGGESLQPMCPLLTSVIATPRSTTEVAHGFHHQVCQALQLSIKDVEKSPFKKSVVFFFKETDH